ncbi:MAG: 3-hydroxyacyl-CoA dehydrogenase family protein, partial [Thermoguttaceae bacterium]
MFSFDNLPNMTTLNARALENVRAMVAWKRQDAGLAGKSSDARPIRSVGIIGAGTMGAEIAAAHIKRNLPLTIFDNNPDALATIAERTSIELAAGGESEDSRASVDRLLRPTAELAEAAKCDLIIESILESLPAKRELFGRLHDLLAAETIVASNTSTIRIGKLAESIPSPGRFCGLHFCHPVRERPLVEIVRGAKTGNETIATLAAHAKGIDKLPVAVADGPGFLVNRLLLPYLAEALELLMEGVSIEMIENAAIEFGMAKGPFRLMDEIGLDTTLQAGWCMAAVFPDRIPISPLLVALIKLGRLGQKSGA